MVDGSDIDHAQLMTFAKSADAATGNIMGYVNTLDGELQTLQAACLGNFASRFASVRAQMQDELNVMRTTLHATAVDAADAAVDFAHGDAEQDQVVAKAATNLGGIFHGLPV